MFGFLFALPMWIRVIFFLIGNGPQIISLIKEIRALLDGLKEVDKREVMKMSMNDLQAYKRDRNKQRLMSSIRERRAEYDVKLAKRKARRMDKSK